MIRFVLKIALFLTSLTLVVPAQAAPATATAQIQALLARPNILCGRFEQSKQLVGIKKPLLSQGRFCVVENKGILWRTLRPFPNTLHLTRDAIVQMEGDRVAMRLDAQQEPVVRMINSVLFSLLAGDLSELEKLFNINAATDKGQWRATLKAKSPALAKAVGDITLQGGAFVKQLTMLEGSGDRTHIIFSALSQGDKAMSAEERASLEQDHS